MVWSQDKYKPRKLKNFQLFCNEWGDCNFTRDHKDYDVSKI